MIVTRKEIRQIIRETIILEGKSHRYSVGGLSDRNVLKTGQVKFSWGSYTGEHAGENYWIVDGERDLGPIQTKGDPYTYKKASGGKLFVVSAPESGRSSVGETFSKSGGSSKGGVRAADVKIASENPCTSLSKVDIIERLKPMMLEEIMSEYSPNRSYTHTVFARGGLLGPVSDERGFPSWNFSMMTLKEFIDNKDMIVDAYDEMYESGESKTNGKNTWEAMVYNPSYGLGLGIIVKNIMDGQASCPAG